MKFLVFLLLAVLSLTACNKSSSGPSPFTEVTGQVLYGGDPYADGLGYCLVTDSTHEYLSLQGLPAAYKHTDVNQHVSIRFFDTGQTLTVNGLPGVAGPRIVVVRVITPL